ncbi:LysE family translocator [Ahrensia kielensis]|uniref:LysE family translocator n=1 Tax=Ahrensia kielensis TaxID=76980 RepID=UPI000370E238|nr:LysE family transporter [Ahrensia kielensis]
MSFEHIIVIISITWLAVISPGADFAVVSRNSSVHGRSAGLASSAGIASGCWIHVAYAIFGLALIIEFFPDLFTYIQTAGAAYLIYIGISTALAKPISDVPNSHILVVTNWRHYGTGVLTNSLNPKTSIFVISLYSQVIGAQTPIPVQLLWGAFISASHFIWFAAISYFMSAPQIRSWVLRHQKAFNLVIGIILALLGVLLFLADDLGGAPLV